MLANERVRRIVHRLCIESALMEGNVAAQRVAARVIVANAVAVGARKRAEARIEILAHNACSVNRDVARQDSGEALDD